MAKQQLAPQSAHSASPKQGLPKMYVPKEQIAYAKLVGLGSNIGIAVLVITFLVYIFGLVPGLVTPEQTAANWHLSTSEYLQATNSPSGWAWLGMLNYGNFLSLLGCAWLGILTIIAYLVFLVPAYFKQKDVPFFTIAVVEVIVLVLAASGILGSGGH